MNVKPTATRIRRFAIATLAIIAAAVIGVAVFVRSGDEPAATPMDIEWSEGGAFVSDGDGRILRLTVSGDRIDTEVLVRDLAFPRGLAVLDGLLYVAELGDLPCEDPVPRCKGEHVGPTTAEGEREILMTSAGRILAFPILASGGLGEPHELVDQLAFTNTDHGLNDLEAGPDGMLYLSVGNLDHLAWHDSGHAPPAERTERLGSILRIDPASGEIESFAVGLRNVFGLAFDEAGTLWGVDNDGPGRDVWRFEELLRIDEGLDFGFPDDGTVGPYNRRTGFASWIMPTGAGSSGLAVVDGAFISGGCGSVTRVELRSTSGDATVDEATYAGCLTAIVPMSDGRLLLGTVLGADAFSVTPPDALFDQ